MLSDLYVREITSAMDVVDSIRQDGSLCTGPFVLVGYAWQDFLKGHLELSSELCSRLYALHEKCVEFNLLARMVYRFPSSLLVGERDGFLWGKGVAGDASYSSHLCGLPCVERSRAVSDFKRFPGCVDSIGFVDVKEVQQVLAELGFLEGVAAG